MRHVAIFGCPRSGTSWLGQILNASEHVAYRYQPLFSYEFKDWFGRRGVSEESLLAFRQALLDARSDFVLQDLRPAKGEPTHLVWKEVRYHALMASLSSLEGLDALVYLFRDPVDVLNSWYLAPKEFRAGQDIHAEWLHAPTKNVDACEFNGFARWKTSMRLACALAERHPGKFVPLSYERLRADPRTQVERLFATLGLAVSPQVDAFIGESTSRQVADPYAVFRTEQTPLALPEDIVAAIEGDAEARELLARARGYALA